MQVLALGCLKLSCIFFYRRVFRNAGDKGFDAFLSLAVVIIVVWTVSLSFTVFFALDY